MATLSIYGRTIELGDLSRMMYPGEDVMTGDVLHYYYRIADTIMPYIRGRLLTMHRFPEGVGRPERRETRIPSEMPPWVRTFEVAGPRGRERASHLIADEPATLVYMAQHASITPYHWLSLASAPSSPDLVVFDLDPAGPGPGQLDDLRHAAQLLREVLRSLGLMPFVMTTGSRGLHVRAPILPERDHRQVASFAARVAELVAATDPGRLSTSPGAHRLDGKVLIDARRNGYGRTVVAPYALRALPGAPVATPLAWEELGVPFEGLPEHTMRSIFPRLARVGDPWKGMASCAAPLPSGVERRALARRGSAEARSA